MVIHQLETDAAVALEGVHGATVNEALVALYQCPRDVKVQERDDGLYLRFVQQLEEPQVVGNAFLVYLAVAVGDDAAPADGEAVRREPQLAHEGHVLLKVVVAVGGNGSVCLVGSA